MKTGEVFRSCTTLDAMGLDYLNPVGAENPWVRECDKSAKGVSERAILEMASLNPISIQS